MLLNPVQERAIHHFDSSLCLSSGAGCGKTTVLCEKYLEALRRGLSPHEIVAITFTDKAASEMKGRILKSTVISEGSLFITTIHGFCRNLLRRHGIHIHLNPLFEVIDEPTALSYQNEIIEKNIDLIPEELVREYSLFHLKRIFLSLLSDRERAKKVFEKHPRFDEILKFFEENKKEGDAFEEALEKKAQHMITSFKQVFEMFSAIYQDLKTEKGVLDFEDLLEKARNLLRDQKNILKEYQSQLKLMMVDEFQDTDELQKEIVELLVGGTPIHLFVVGDPKQSIYRFRGAQVEVFSNMRDSILKNGGAEYFLQDNYRSGSHIIRFINSLFGKVFANTSIPYVELINNTDVNDGIHLIEIHGSKETHLELRQKEAHVLSHKIIDLHHKGVPYKDMAFLFRAMTHADLYLQTFHEYNIPAFLVDDSQFFENREIQDLCCFLQAIFDPKNEIALAAILRGPFFSLSDEVLYWMHREGGSLNQGLEKPHLLLSLKDSDHKILQKARKLILYLRQFKDRYSVSEMLKIIRHETPFDFVTHYNHDAVQRKERLERFLHFVNSHSHLTLSQFLNTVETLKEYGFRLSTTEEELKLLDGVCLMSVHKSKGLEFPAVFLPDIGYRAYNQTALFLKSQGVGLSLRDSALQWKETYWKKVLKKWEEQKEEEESKRLFYVAVTRAQKYLTLSATKEGKGSWLSFLKSSKLNLNDLGVEVQHLSPSHCEHREAISSPSVMGSPQSLMLLRDDKKKKSLKGVTFRIGNDFPLKKPSLEYSVTALQQYETCPFKFRKRYLEEIPEFLPHHSEYPSCHPERSEGSNPLEKGAQIGTEVHRVLENWDFTKEEGFEQYSGPSSASKEDITNILERLKNLPIFERMKRSRKIYKEYPFYYKLGDFRLEGIVDLLFEDSEGKWVTLDYKTNKIESSQVKKTGLYYEFQTDAYAWMLSKIVHPIHEVIVLFLRPGLCYQYTWNVSREKHIQRRIEGIFKNIQEEKFAAKLGGHCKYCGYQSLCDKYIQSARQNGNLLQGVESRTTL
ncbi:MAG: UvrD-helicase domain-containing protein [Deltaproteobacteria bacterium]|nr:UvrD-helicase domain-containing protein [Deltaproteobacteria bacterium]